LQTDFLIGHQKISKKDTLKPHLTILIMNRLLPTFKGIGSTMLLLVLLAFTANVSGQASNIAFKPAKTFLAAPGTYFQGPVHHYDATVTTCDSDIYLDYSTYDEIVSDDNGINYNGSWNTATPAPYANYLSSLLNRIEADSFQAYQYAGVAFDTLAIGNFAAFTNSSVAYANSTVTIDSIRFYGGLSGDSLLMTHDSLVFTIFGDLNGNVTLVKKIVYTGMSQLRQFYLPSEELAGFQIPVGSALAQGQSFGIDIEFINHDTSGHFLLAYSYADSCGTIVYLGNTYGSPAHLTSLPGTSFWGAQVDTLTTSVTVDAQSDLFAYNIPGIPQNCLFVYPQNWEIIPIIKICQTATVTAPAVVTDAANFITSSTATLNGTVNAEGASSTTGFDWGLTTAYGSTATGVPSPVLTVASVSAALSGLTASTTYHFRAYAINTAGTTYGSDLTFTTSSASSCDTFFNEVSVLDTPSLEGAGAGNGFVSGNNVYGDLAKAEGFTSVIGDHVSSAYLLFGYANYNVADANNTVKIMLWDNSGTSLSGAAGAPGNALDSATLTLSQIKTAVTGGLVNEVVFPNNVALTTSGFYVGVVLPTTTGDTVALVSNTGNGSTDGDGWELDGPPSVITDGWQDMTTDWGFPGSFGNYIEAVLCPAQATSSCTPAAGAPVGVSPAALQVPCITQGVNYSETYTLVVPDTFAFNGTTLTINSITIDSIGNLPSGLTWTPGVNPETIAGGASGCYIISGTSNAACGEYLTPIYVTANIAGLGNFPLILNATGVPSEFLQVISSGHSCPVADTAQTTPFVADATCGVTAAPSVTVTPTAVGCFGQATGSAAAHATGGSGTYTYVWSNGATTSSISNVIAGTYTVTVTSGGQTATASGTVTQPSAALNATASATQTSCTGSTGTATAVVTGGTVSYNYHWSNGGTVASLTGLGANTYNLTVTDANGCSATATTAVTIPAAFTVSVVVTDVACFGASTGIATANTTGSSGTLTYNWSNGTTTQTLSNATAGALDVTVTEASGCSSTGTGAITQPASALRASATATTTSCSSNTGSATVTATGGTTNYTYLWSPGGASTTLVSNLGVGVYTVTVTDAHSCTATASANVNTTATYTVNVTPASVGCYGQSTGSATATVTGASGTVTYDWSNSATTQAINALAAGTYNVTVKDGSGCSKTVSTTVTQPASALSASVTTTQSACSSNTGTATAAVTGGTTAYTYTWNNASTVNPASGFGVGAVNVTVTDANHCLTTASGSVSSPTPPGVSATANPVLCYGQATGSVSATVTGSNNDTYFWSNGGTSANVSNVTANTYTVTVTDGFGCSASASATVTQPASGIEATISTTPQSSCLTDNGSATVTATNGASPYSYVWSNSGGAATISNLASGNYSVTVTDHNGCSASATASVNPAGSFTITVTTTNDLCYGASTGSATVTVTGSGTYTYLWSNSATTATNSNLTTGTYGVTVTNANGCANAGSGLVTQPASALVANATATNSTCGTSSGTASVAVVGGTGSPSYLWNNNAVTSSIVNLGVGVYTVTVTEGTCTATASAIVNNLNGPTVSMLSSNPSCSYSTDGTASAVAAGGTGPYSYTWSNNQTTSGLTSLGAGTYNVIVSDHTGCQVAGSVTLTAPAALVLTPTIVNATCEGNQNGTINLTVTGGTQGYSYSWSNGSGGADVTGLAAGNVTVTVTDAQHCTANGSYNVNQPTAIQISITTTDASNGANGSATASATGGIPPYTYQWANSVTATASNLAVGSYTVTVADANHCSATALATIIPSGIDNVTSNITSITLMPNPASDVVKVVVSLSTPQTVEFRILDITGKYIYTARENTGQGTVTHAIDLNEFASGIYLVEITAGSDVSRQRLVITK